MNLKKVGQQLFFRKLSLFMFFIFLIMTAGNLHAVDGDDPGEPEEQGLPTESKGVSASGNFNHSIPIQVPTGTNGQTIDFSLEYASLENNGKVGIGWALKGIPIIARMPYGEGIKYNGNDTYLFSDGGRLVEVSAGVYHTANESWTKFMPGGTCGDGPCFWTVYDNDGNTIQFGGDTDSRIEAIGKNGSVRIWSMNKVEDTYGNEIIISHDEDTTNGDYYPTDIIWSVNNGQTRHHKVSLSWESRDDHFIQYVHRAKVDTDKRLSSIKVYTNCTASSCSSGLIREYQLTYQYGNSGRSRLVSVKTLGDDGPSTLS